MTEAHNAGRDRPRGHGCGSRNRLCACGLGLRSALRRCISFSALRAYSPAAELPAPIRLAAEPGPATSQRTAPQRARQPRAPAWLSGFRLSRFRLSRSRLSGSALHRTRLFPPRISGICPACSRSAGAPGRLAQSAPQPSHPGAGADAARRP